MLNESNNTVHEETDEERHLRHQMIREKYKRMNKRRIDISCFVMTFIFFIQILTFGVYVSMYSDQTISKSIITVDYYDAIYDLIIEKIGDVSNIYNLPDSVYKNVISKNDVESILSTYTSGLSDAIPQMDVPVEKFRFQIKNNTINYLKSKNIKVTESIEKNVDTFVDKCCKTFSENLIFSHMKLLYSAKKFLTNAIIILTVLSLVSILLCIYLINKSIRNKKQLLRYVSYSVGTSSFIILIVSFLLRKKIIPIFVTGISDYCKFKLVRGYTNAMLDTLISFGVVLAVIYLIIVGIWYYLTFNRPHGHY